MRKDDWITKLHYKEFLKPKLQPEDFYWEKGKMIMTEKYHLKRGYCCKNGCRHCPYEYTRYNKNTRKNVSSKKKIPPK